MTVSALGNRQPVSDRLVPRPLCCTLRQQTGRIAEKSAATKVGQLAEIGFGDKASLFSEVFKRLLVPFTERITNTYEHLSPAEQIFEMFSVYESFVTENRATIETFVRWVMESPELRALLSDQLLGLQDTFTRKIERALAACTGDPELSAELAAGLIAMLDGNFLLTLLDSEGKHQARRRAGLLGIARLAVRAERGE